jgi:hypothetical protein
VVVILGLSAGAVGFVDWNDTEGPGPPKTDRPEGVETLLLGLSIALA